MRGVLTGVLLATLVLLLGPIRADDKNTDQPKDVSYWMKKKLELTKDMMSGLAVADFDELQQSAKTMRTLNKIEGWVRRIDTKEYRRQLKFFEQANEELLRHALDENVDGATLAFTQMTLSCVNCHKHLRDSDDP